MYSKEHNRNLPHYAIECGSSIALKVEMRPLRSKDRGILWDNDDVSTEPTGSVDVLYTGVGVSVNVQMSYQLNRPPTRKRAVEAMRRILTRPFTQHEATQQDQCGSSFATPVDITSDDESTNINTVSQHGQVGSSSDMPIILC